MQRISHLAKLLFYFLVGAIFTSVIVVSIAYIALTAYFKNRIYPGVHIGPIDASELTPAQLSTELDHTPKTLTVSLLGPSASTSAQINDLQLTPQISLMVSRAYSIGRQTTNPYYNLLQIIAAQNGQINLPFEYTFDHTALNSTLDTIAPQIEKPALNAQFTFIPNAGPDAKGRVQAFSPSQNGIAIDRDKISNAILAHISSNQPLATSNLTVPLYTKILYPDIQTSTANDMGIKTLLGQGVSYFYDSIPTRVYNIQLGTSKVSGRLVAPGEIFSFDESIGTVSAVFGFQKAYSIIQGKTVLDDGGGVCQVSTTIYRAVLNAGLPVVARTAHAYRVSFYEEGGFKPGMDATVYPPNPDFKFQNDTGNWLLLQANFDGPNHKLTFDIFGTDDGRKTVIGGPYILSVVPPPDPITEDDPTKPVGTVIQVDTAHPGANVYFTRIVTRGDQTLINETVKSNYIPWPARFLRGTKT